MGKTLDKFMEYIENTPKEELDRKFDEIYSEFSNVGPTAKEYLHYVKETTDNPEIKDILKDY